jgi:DNA-directed RNA polymerase specialized sigma24 family protein
VTDLLAAYRAATAEQAELQQRVDALGVERARLLAELKAAGASYQDIAAQIGTSRGLVQKLIARHQGK